MLEVEPYAVAVTVYAADQCLPWIHDHPWSLGDDILSTV